MLFQRHNAETALNHRYFYPLFTGLLFGNIPVKRSQWGTRVQFK